MRILVLLAFGGLVYFKFDAFVSSRAFHSLSHPRAAWTALRAAWTWGGPAAASLPGPAWSPDSAGARWECPGGDLEACLRGWRDEAAAGRLRALVHKARAQLQIPADGPLAATLVRRDNDPKASGEGLFPVTLEIRNGKDTWSLREAPEGSGRFCTPHFAGPVDGCLDARHPAAPFARFRRLDETGAAPAGELTLAPLDGPSFHAVLPGRIMAMPAPGSDARHSEVKLYHGGNLFSLYRGFARLRPGLAMGSFLAGGDTLGFVGAEPDARLTLAVEQDGMPLDPAAFLGAAEPAEDAHAR